MPLCACEHSAPTAKKRLATATPNAPLLDRATMDQVMHVRIQHCERFAWQPSQGSRLRAHCSVPETRIINASADRGDSRALASPRGVRAPASLLAPLPVRYSREQVKNHRQHDHGAEAEVNREQSCKDRRDD